MLFVQRKNLLINLWLLLASIITLISNFNPISLVVISIFLIIIFLKTVITNKDNSQGIIENSVAYLSFTYILFYFLNKQFVIDLEALENNIENLLESVLSNIIVFIIGIVVFLVLCKISSMFQNRIFKCFSQYFALIILLLSVNTAFTQNQSFGLILIILSVFALSCNIFTVSKNNKASNSFLWLLIPLLITVIFEGLFDSSSVFNLKLNLVLNDLLPWYVILAITVIAWLCSGYIFGSFLDKEESDDMDCYILSAFAGFVLLLKSIVYYSYPLSWMFMIIFIVASFFMIWGRITNKKRDITELGGQAISVALTAYGLSIANIMVYYGYFAVLMVLTIGIPTITYIGNNIRGWFGIFLKNSSIVIVGVLLAVSVSKHNYISEEYLEFIITAALVVIFFVFAINFKSNKNRNTEDKIYSSILAVTFAFLAFFSAFRSGTDIDIKLDKNGSNLTNDSIIVVEVDPQGKDNEIVSLEYYWKDTFGLNSGSSNIDSFKLDTGLGNQSFSLGAQEGELVIVSIDSNGIKTQKSMYFFVN